MNRRKHRERNLCLLPGKYLTAKVRITRKASSKRYRYVHIVKIREG